MSGSMEPAKAKWREIKPGDTIQPGWYMLGICADGKIKLGTNSAAEG